MLKKEVEDLTDDPVATEAVIEEQVLVHHGFGVELMEEDLQKWTTTYKEDIGHITVYTKLRQGQKHEDFYLNPSGLMAKMAGGQQKIIVPRSLRQQILKECHDVPFIGHVGMRKTLELVDRPLHWRGLRGDAI